MGFAQFLTKVVFDDFYILKKELTSYINIKLKKKSLHENYCTLL